MVRNDLQVPSRRILYRLLCRFLRYDRLEELYFSRYRRNISSSFRLLRVQCISIIIFCFLECCLQLDQATLGMPGREYLIKGLEDKDVKAYLEYQVGLATLLGADKESARKQQTEAVEFEIKLATVIIG